jgi:suppressor for copper-sensitivity B
VLAAAKTAGLAVGWGIQFQQPVFLAALAAVTTAFAANLFGLFEIPLPSALAAMLSGRTPPPPGQHSLAGSFVTGVLATVLATPCSAPFLGTAVGFGLAGSVADIFAIFLCLGLGLAAPYLLLAAMPWLSRFLPRPGHWMLTLRRLLGLPLLATAVWLVGVIAGEAGALPALVVAGLGGGALLAMMIAARGVRASSVAVLLFLAMPLAALSLAVTPESRVATRDGIWQGFDPARVPREVAAGHVVFVDVTADWCLTCKANEIAVLDKAPVHPRLARAGVVAMRADWTRPDPRVAQLLADFQRYGIPLYVVYGPGTPAGEALPEVITPGAVAAALDRAAAVIRTP